MSNLKSKLNIASVIRWDLNMNIFRMYERGNTFDQINLCSKMYINDFKCVEVAKQLLLLPNYSSNQAHAHFISNVHTAITYLIKPLYHTSYFLFNPDYLAQRGHIPGSMTLPGGHLTKSCRPSRCVTVIWKPQRASTKPIRWVIWRSLPSRLKSYNKNNNKGKMLRL